MRRRLGAHLKQVILFGSRARGDAAPDSGYDCLAVLDEVSPVLTGIIDEVAGEILYQYSAVFSVFPIAEERYHQPMYSPFLMNVYKEGITL